MYEDETENKIDKLYEESTTEQNGVEIIVDFDYTKINEFRSKIREQLLYFPNLNIKELGYVKNEPTIYENEMFKYSSNCPSGIMHICFSNVYYPIDWSKLGIPQINIPIGIKIGLDERILPTLNREQLIYSVETKQLIIQKIETVKKWLINLYNSGIPNEFNSYSEAYSFITNTDKYVVINDNVSFNITCILNRDITKIPSIKNVKYLDIFEIHNKLYFDNYSKAMYKNWGRRWKYGGWIGINDIFESSKNIYLLDKSIRLSGYYKSYCQQNGTVFIQKDENLKLNRYKSILNLNNFSKSEWRERIIEYQNIIDSIIKEKIIDYTNIINSEDFADFKEENKPKRKYSSKKIEIEEGDVSIKKARYSLKSSSDTILFSTVGVNSNKLRINKKKSYLFNADEKEMAINFYQGLKGRIDVYVTNQKTINKFDKTKNVMIFSKIKDNNINNLKEFKKIATSALFQEEIYKYNSIVDINTPFDLLSQNIRENVIKLEAYIKANEYEDTEYVKEIIQKAKETDNFDKSLWEEYTNLVEFNNNFNFLEFIHIDKRNPQQNERVVRFINEILLFRKQKFPDKYKEFEISVTKKEEEIEAESF